MTMTILLLSTYALAYQPDPVGTIEGAAASYPGVSSGSAGDIDGDGYDDILVGRAGAVGVHHGGPGGPSVEASYDLPSPAAATSRNQYNGAIGDVNGDGFDDVAIVLGGPQEGTDHWIEIRYGSVFGLPLEADLEWHAPMADAFGTATAVAWGDLDEDGFDDVVVGAPGGNRVDVFLGGAAGLPSTPSLVLSGDPSDGQLGYAIAVGDADGDGHLDILASDRDGADETLLFLGDGAGGVRDQVTLVGGTGLVALVDFDGDGTDTPVLLGATTELHVGAYPNFSSTVERVVTEWPHGYSNAADIDGDGLTDLVVGGGGSYTILYGQVGALPQPERIDLPGSLPVGRPTLVDADGDGALDLLHLTYLHHAQLTFDVASPTGDIVWALPEAISSGSWSQKRPMDVNGDGFEDLAWFDDGSICILRGGPGGLAPAPSWSVPLHHAASGDVNGDGISDIVGVRDDIELVVFGGRPGGPTTLPDQVLPLPVDHTVSRLDFSQDMNADGLLDLVVLLEGSITCELAVFRAGAGGLKRPLRVPLSVPCDHVVGLADVNGDAFPDMLVADYELSDTGELGWVQGSATGPTGRPTFLTVPPMVHPRIPATVGDFDGDGFDDFAFRTTRWTTEESMVIHGSATGPDVARSFVLDRVPRWAGDLDGDGLDDLVTNSAVDHDYDGEIGVHYGAVGGLPTVADEVLVGQDRESLGADIMGADLDGDGLREIVARRAYDVAFELKARIFQP